MGAVKIPADVGVQHGHVHPAGGQRLGQKELAYAVTARVHGREVADRCVAMTQALFSGDFATLSTGDALELARSMEGAHVSGSIGLLEALVTTGLASSKTEARRFVTGNAVRVNGTKVSDPNLVLDAQVALGGRVIFLHRGKKNTGAIILD